MQHLCEHSLPAALAFSQQDSARTLTAPRMANAQAAAMSDLIAFICIYLLFAGNRPAALTRFRQSTKRPSSGTKDGRVMGGNIFKGRPLSMTKCTGDLPPFFRFLHLPAGHPKLMLDF